jgi:S-adenosylmethionine:tRNA ribosyltransferase-isomerase
VGSGTFQPVRSEMVEQHRMHSERYDVPQATLDAISAAKARTWPRARGRHDGPARSEAYAKTGRNCGDTDLFIYPGFEFRLVDRLLTNFHLPKSSLLMLVAAFAGFANIQRAYAHAIRERYRFFSYGDAMLLERAK